MSETYSIGVDLGGTNLRIAFYNSGVDFLDTITIPTRLSEGRECVVRDMCEAIKALAARQHNSCRLDGIAIGTPGPLELPEGILRNPPNLIGWDGFNLRHAFESVLGSSVAIESDANLAALAEQQLRSYMPGSSGKGTRLKFYVRNLVRLLAFLERVF